MTQPLPGFLRPRREKRDGKLGGGCWNKVRNLSAIHFTPDFESMSTWQKVIDHFILLFERLNRLEIKYFRGVKSGHPDSSVWLCSPYSNSSVFLCLVAPNVFAGIPFWSLIPLKVDVCSPITTEVFSVFTLKRLCSFCSWAHWHQFNRV